MGDLSKLAALAIVGFAHSFALGVRLNLKIISGAVIEDGFFLSFPSCLQATRRQPVQEKLHFIKCYFMLRRLYVVNISRRELSLDKCIDLL